MKWKLELYLPINVCVLSLSLFCLVFATFLWHFKPISVNAPIVPILVRLSRTRRLLKCLLVCSFIELRAQESIRLGWLKQIVEALLIGPARSQLPAADICCWLAWAALKQQLHIFPSSKNHASVALVLLAATAGCCCCWCCFCCYCQQILDILLRKRECTSCSHVACYDFVIPAGGAEIKMS